MHLKQIDSREGQTKRGLHSAMIVAVSPFVFVNERQNRVIRSLSVGLDWTIASTLTRFAARAKCLERASLSWLIWDGN
jgi:hypothetical protein